MNRILISFVALLSSGTASAGWSTSGAILYTRDEGQWEILAEGISDYSGTGMSNTSCATTSSNWLDQMKALYPNTMLATDGDAWSADFEEASLDDSMNDAVDLSYYCGHGGSGAFTFNGDYGDDLVQAAETSWGDGDVESVAIHSCQVLDSAGRSAFGTANKNKGAHFILGFESNALDTTAMGTKYGQYLAAGYTIRQAWVSATMDTHSSSYKAAYVRFYDSSCNTYNDKATTAPSCNPSRGSWVYSTWTL